MPYFAKLTSQKGLSELDEYLFTKSYIEGYAPSQSDVKVFDTMTGEDLEKYPNVSRWYKHIASWTAEERKKWEGDGINVTITEDADEEEDDFELFGDDDDEEAAAEAKKLAEQKKKEREAKEKKGAAKSMIVMDVKPWDDDTDMEQMEKNVRTIELEGLVWGASKLEEVGYGIQKLVISCVVEDDKVFLDDLEERITEDSDHVQSCDVAAFQKM